MIVFLEIRTWAGYIGTASHYYGTLRVFGEDPDKRSRDVTHILSKAQAVEINKISRVARAEYPGEDAFLVKPGDESTVFGNEKVLCDAAVKNYRKEGWFPEAKILIKGMRAIVEPQLVLDGDRKDELNALYYEADKIGWWANDRKEMKRIESRWRKILNEVAYDGKDVF